MNSRSSGSGGFKNSNLNSVLSKQDRSSSSQNSSKPYANGLVALGAPKVGACVLGDSLVKGCWRSGVLGNLLLCFRVPSAARRSMPLPVHITGRTSSVCCNSKCVLLGSQQRSRTAAGPAAAKLAVPKPVNLPSLRSVRLPDLTFVCLRMNWWFLLAIWPLLSSVPLCVGERGE